MRTLVARYYGPDDVRLEEATVPAPGPGEIVVRIEACGLCGSDTMDWYLRDRAPLVLGHEPAGVVVAVGPGVTTVAPGDRVFVHHHVPCFVCEECRRGHQTLCRLFHQTRLDPGGFSQYARVPAPNVALDVLPLPPHLSFAEATLIEPLACCLRAWQRLTVVPGDTVAVIGCGVTGLLHLTLARRQPVGRVLAVDPVPFRREAARRLGADATADPAEAATACRSLDPRGADLVIICAGNTAAIAQGLTLAARGATVLLFAPTPPEATLPISPHRLFFDELTVLTSYSATPLETRAALALLAQGQVPAPALITHQLPLAAVGQALRLARQGDQALKIVIHPWAT